ERATAAPWHRVVARARIAAEPGVVATPPRAAGPARAAAHRRYVCARAAGGAFQHFTAEGRAGARCGARQQPRPAITRDRDDVAVPDGTRGGRRGTGAPAGWPGRAQ